MRTPRMATIGAGTAVAALAITGWLAPAYGKVAANTTRSNMSSMSSPPGTTALAADIAAARQATAKYATNLAMAKADGYFIITKMVPSMAITS